MYHMKLIINTFETGIRPQFSQFFATPWLGVLDVLRVFCLIGFGLYAGRAMYALRYGWMPDWWRKVMLVGTVVAGWSIVETEWDHIGLYVGVGGRLWFNVFAVTCFLVGSYKMLDPTKTRENKQKLQENVDPLELP